jgi:hypothetical protein
MKKYDPRLWLGGLLIFGGLLALLENMGVLSDVSDIFWGLIWGGVGVYFLYRLFVYKEWWAAFPGFVLVGLALANFLPDPLEGFEGLVFFAGIGAAFLWVYFTDTTRWWAIIPAGVMLTLGAISALDDFFGIENDGFFFLGLGLTFILVAILPGGRARTWALIPGAIMLILGALTSPAIGVSQYIWPAALILVGGWFVLRFFRKESTV